MWVPSAPPRGGILCPFSAAPPIPAPHYPSCTYSPLRCRHVGPAHHRGGRPWDVPARCLVFSQPPASPAWPSSARSRVGWRENRFPSSPASGGRVGRPGRPASPRAGRSFPEEASRTERRHRLVNAGPRFLERACCVNRIAVNHVASASYRHRAVDSLESLFAGRIPSPLPRRHLYHC